VSIKTQETCKPVPPRWTTAKIQAEKRVCVLCVNPAICAVCAVLAVRSFNNLRWHNRGRGFESHPLRHKTVQSLQSIVDSQTAHPASYGRSRKSLPRACREGGNPACSRPTRTRAFAGGNTEVP